jgi:hypothetical protein
MNIFSIAFLFIIIKVASASIIESHNDNDGIIDSLPFIAALIIVNKAIDAIFRSNYLASISFHSFIHLQTYINNQMYNLKNRFTLLNSELQEIINSLNIIIANNIDADRNLNNINRFAIADTEFNNSMEQIRNMINEAKPNANLTGLEYDVVSVSYAIITLEYSLENANNAKTLITSISQFPNNVRSIRASLEKAIADTKTIVNLLLPIIDATKQLVRELIVERDAERIITK